MSTCRSKRLPLDKKDSTVTSGAKLSMIVGTGFENKNTAPVEALYMALSLKMLRLSAF